MTILPHPEDVKLYPQHPMDGGYKGDIATDLKKGTTLDGKEYKVHLDGYNQLSLLTGQGKTARSELWYFTESTMAAARIGDYKYAFPEQPDGWFDPKVKRDWPRLYNLELNPFEKMSVGDSMYAANWWTYEFWRFVFVQQPVAVLANTPESQTGFAQRSVTAIRRLADQDE